MLRIASLGLALALVTACATPQHVKDASHQQSELLGKFHKTLGELSTKLLEFYDAEIAEFRQGLLNSRMELEKSRLTQRAHEESLQIDPSWPSEKRIMKIKELMDAAANYLNELPEFYFQYKDKKKFCEVWLRLKPKSLRGPDEKCPDKHIDPYQNLVAGRAMVAERFDQLIKNIAKTREAQDLVNEFLQIEFRLTPERIDEAKKVLKEAGDTIDEVKNVWSE
jgi:hypothetical protein